MGDVKEDSAIGPPGRGHRIRGGPWRTPVPLPGLSRYEDHGSKVQAGDKIHPYQVADAPGSASPTSPSCDWRQWFVAPLRAVPGTMSRSHMPSACINTWRPITSAGPVPQHLWRPLRRHRSTCPTHRTVRPFGGSGTAEYPRGAPVGTDCDDRHSAAAVPVLGVPLPKNLRKWRRTDNVGARGLECNGNPWPHSGLKS